MGRTAADLTRRERFRALTTSAISLLALMLVVMGIYGNMAFAVSQRRHEIAIRLALGDSGAASSVVSSVMPSCFRRVASCWACSAPWPAGRWLESLIAGVAVRDALMGLVTALLLVLIAMLAAWGPARAASRVDPSVLLKGN